jgi:hypothetical protein
MLQMGQNPTIVWPELRIVVENLIDGGLPSHEIRGAKKLFSFAFRVLAQRRDLRYYACNKMPR